MDFLNKLLRPLFSPRSNKIKPAGIRRSPQIESLEARELLAVSILSTPVTAYAQQDNPAEIRFDLTTQNGATTRVDFVAQQTSGSTLNPSQLTLVNRSTGQTVTLSSVVDGAASSTATAYLKSGSYSILVAADSGTGGYFTLDILQETGAGSVKSGLDILVAAAISQQQAGWSYRIAHYNALLAGTDYAGAAGTKSILSLYPEVDINGDGVVNGSDLTLAEQLISGGGGVTATASAVTVVPQDLTGPSITVGLKNDTGTVGDKITTDPTVVGRITDASGIKSAQYKLDSGAWVSLSLDASGNYTIANSAAAGTRTVTISATDTKGNTTTSAYTFIVVSSTGPGNVTGSAVTAGGSGTAKFPGTSTVKTVNGTAIAAGSTITLADNKGTVSLAADGTLTFSPGSYYKKLAQGETETLALSVVSIDAYGHSYTSAVSFTVTGKNDLPVLSDTTRPNLNVNENSSGTVAAATLLGKWTDPDNGAVLSLASASVYSTVCSNAALSGKYTASALASYVTLTSTGIQLNATSSFFDALGAGETLTITVAYKVKDQYGISGDTGYLTFTVLGQNDAPVLAAVTTTFSGVVSNDTASPLKTINPGFTATDADHKDSAALTYSYSNVSNGANTVASGLITNFNAATGTFDIDTSKLANRNVASTVTLVVTVGTVATGTASKTITINLAPQTTAPTAPPVSLAITETQSAAKTVTPTVAGSGWSVSNLQVVTETGYGSLPTGVSLSSVATLVKNTDGTIGFTFNPGANFEYLKAGETLKLKLRYTITDTQYNLSGAGTIELTITGVTSPAVPPTGGPGVLGAGGGFSTTEAGGSAPAVTVSKSAILSGWTLPDGATAYSLVAGKATFSSWSGNGTYSVTTNPLGTNSFGSVNFDASGNLVFTPDASAFVALGAGQYVDLAVAVQVMDASGNLVPGGTVLIRVNGSNDAPTLTWRQDSGFRFASNAKAGTVSIDPGFTKSDVDLNNPAASLNYSLDAASTSLGFNIGADGVITVGNGKLAALSGTYSIVVTLRDSFGAATSKTITASFYAEAAPTLTASTLTVGEKAGSTATNLNNYMTKKTGHAYSFSQSPTPTHYSTDGVTWLSLSGSGYDLTGRYTFDSSTGGFTFDPNGAFDDLTSGESLYFKFEYRVSDDGYNNCVSIGSLVVRVSGVNDAPIQTSTSPRTEIVTESISAPKKTVAGLLDTWADPDHVNSELKISALEITSNGGATLISLAELRTVASGFLKISADGRSVEIDPSHEIFRKLGLGESVSLTIRYVVIDPKGGTGTDSFTLVVNGSNDPPTLVFGDYVWTVTETQGSARLSLAPFVADADVSDSPYVVKINGTSVATGQTVTLGSGASLKYLGGLLVEFYTNGKYESLSQGASAFENFVITITDGHAEAGAATLKVEIRGEHTPIRLVSPATVTKTVDLNGLDASGRIDAIQVWKDSDDTLKYTVVCTGSDGNTYPNLFLVAADGTFRLDPAKIASLDKNLTYTVAVTVENAAAAYGDPTLSVTYTLDFIHRAVPVISDQTLTVSQNDAGKTKDLTGAYAPEAGYSHTVTLTVNDTGLVLVPGVDYTIENGVFNFLAGSKFVYLQTGETETFIFTYKITDLTQGGGSICAEATLTVTVAGANDAPVFTAPGTIVTTDDAAVEIPWADYFSDVDRNDTLTLTGIGGVAFDVDGEVNVAGIGVFRLDVDGTLWFTPETGFAALKSGHTSGLLTVALNVVDGQGATNTGRADVALEVMGTNKVPVITESDVPNKSVKETIVITAEDIATDLNGDDLRFDSIKIEGIQLIDDVHWNDTKNAWILTLASGTTLTLAGDKTALSLDGTTRYAFLPFGDTEDFSLDFIVADEHDALSVEATVTTAFDGLAATAPNVGDHTVTGVTEDDTETPTAIRLGDYISDSNVPNRGAADWYSIAWNGLISAKIDGVDLDSDRLDTLLLECLWKYDQGVLTFEKAPAGYFDFLAEGETLTLIFSYDVTDNEYKDGTDTFLSSQGAVTIEIEGVNDDPTISGTVTLHNSNSGYAEGADVILGNLAANDVDNGDAASLSVGHVTVKHNNRILDVDPVLYIRETDGVFLLVNSGLPEIPPGECLVFTVEIVAEDTFGGTITKTYVFNLHAKKEPIVAVDGTELNASEGDFGLSTDIIVTDPEEAFISPARSGDDWYHAPTITVTVPEAFTNRIPDPASLFSVIGDGATGYKLNFTGRENDFDFLREGEPLVFTVTISVVDKRYGVTGTETVTVTVTGKGDAHTVAVGENSFTYWVNRREPGPTAFDPAYDISDADWNSSYVYSLQNVTVADLPTGFTLDELKALISIDSETGEISVDKAGLAGLADSFTFSLTVRVAATGEYSDDYCDDVAVTLNVALADAPVVSGVAKTVDETGSVSESLAITPPVDAAPRDANWYDISGPSLAGLDFDYTGPLPEGFDWDAILTGLADIENGVFEFDTNSLLGFLPKGSTLVLTYEFTVRDKIYDTSTTRNAIVTILGKNNQGAAAGDFVVDGVHKIGSSEGHEVVVSDLADLVNDIDLGDRHTIVSIDGIVITHNEWITIPDKGEFYYYGGTLGSDGLYYGGTLKYRPSATAFESLRYGATKTLAFVFLLRDDSGAGNATTTPGGFEITITGTNKMPVVKANQSATVKEGEIVRIYAGNDPEGNGLVIGTDVNQGDTLRIYSVNGHTADFQFADGTTVRFGENGAWIEIDTSTRDPNLNMKPGDDALLTLNIAVADDSGAANFVSLAKPVTVTIEGADDPPVMPGTHEFGVSLAGLDGVKVRDFVSVGYLDFQDVDTDISRYTFIVDPAFNNPGFTFDGEIPTWIYFNYNATKFFVGTYTFKVTATNPDNGLTYETLVSITLSMMKAPMVDVSYPDGDAVLNLLETEKTGSVGITVTDPNPNPRTGDWYSVRNIRYAEGSLAVLPTGVTFQYVDGRFVFETNGAFDYLRRGETATLNFEFAVRDVLYGIDTMKTITIVVTGVNDSPVAGDYRSMLNTSADEGIKFYLSDLASDNDAGDTLAFHTVGGATIEKDDASGVAVSYNDNVIGYVYWKSDGKGDYLLFMPNGYFRTLRYGVTESAMFEYTVIDDSLDMATSVSNTGTISFNVVGTNKRPVINTSTGTTNENEVLEIDANENGFASDVNSGDSLRVVAVKYGGIEYWITDRDQAPHVITTASGATLTLYGDGRLVYDPTTRSADRNMSLGDSDLEQFGIVVADDSGEAFGNTLSEWKDFTLEVKGVNEAPVDILPGTTEFVRALEDEAVEFEIDLSKHFTDADNRDTLTFSIKESLENLGFLTVTQSGNILTVRYMKLGEYSNDFDLSAVSLTILADDGNGGVTEKVLTFRVEQQYNAELDVIVAKTPSGTAVGETGTKPTGEPVSAGVGDEYYIEVWASDLINAIIGQGMSLGLGSVAFSLYFNSSLCEILDIDGSSIDSKNGIRVSLDGLNAGVGLNGNDLLLLRLKVRALDEAGVASFTIDPSTIVVTRYGGIAVHASQVTAGSATVTHLGSPDAPYILAFAAPTPTAALQTFAMLQGWTAGDELMNRQGEEELIRKIADELLATTDFSDDDDLWSDPEGETEDDDDMFADLLAALY